MSADARGRVEAMLRSSPGARVAEIVLVFLSGWAIVAVVGARAGTGPLAHQAVVWVANVVMLLLVWAGLRLRGEGLAHLGLGWRAKGVKAVAGLGLRSVGVAVVAAAAFVAGSIVMAVFVGVPEPADTSGYDYLRGNLPLLLLALAAVYVVSSFGEEVIYRGFLMTRIAELGGGGRFAWAAALLASAVVFGLVHYAWGATGMVQTGFMGLALGGAYLYFGRNLWVTVGAHAILDTVLLVQQYAG